MIVKTYANRGILLLIKRTILCQASIYSLLFLKEVNIIDIKQIEDFDRYLIDENGIIYDTEKDMRKICQWIDNVGYKQCNLYDKNRKKYYKRVHRLVAKAFIPNPDNLPQVNHKDGDKTNNHISNLEWTVNSENTKHGYDNNLYYFGTSKSYPINVYSKKTHAFIKTYSSIRELSRELGLNRKTVTSILKGQRKNNYNYLFEYVEEGQSTIESVSGF